MARFLTSDTFAFYLNPAKEGEKKKKNWKNVIVVNDPNSLWASRIDNSSIYFINNAENAVVGSCAIGQGPLLDNRLLIILLAEKVVWLADIDRSKMFKSLLSSLAKCRMLWIFIENWITPFDNNLHCRRGSTFTSNEAQMSHLKDTHAWWLVWGRGQLTRKASELEIKNKKY